MNRYINFVILVVGYLTAANAVNLDLSNTYSIYKGINVNATFKQKFWITTFNLNNKFHCYAKCTQNPSCRSLVLSSTNGSLTCSLYRRNAIINYFTVSSNSDIYATQKSLFKYYYF